MASPYGGSETQTRIMQVFNSGGWWTHEHLANRLGDLTKEQAGGHTLRLLKKGLLRRRKTADGRIVFAVKDVDMPVPGHRVRLKRPLGDFHRQGGGKCQTGIPNA